MPSSSLANRVAAVPNGYGILKDGALTGFLDGDEAQAASHEGKSAVFVCGHGLHRVAEEDVGSFRRNEGHEVLSLHAWQSPGFGREAFGIKVAC